MSAMKITACAPPRCNCPELEAYETVDGEVRVTITDDYNGVVVMTAEEFLQLAVEFIRAVSAPDEEEEHY